MTPAVGNSDEVGISSTVSPRSRSIAASAARNGSSTSGGNGPKSRDRGVARTRFGIPPPYCHAGAADGSPRAGPRITCSSSFASSTPGASGPCVETSSQDGIGRLPISPAVGLRPVSPQNAAGVRIDPPPSVPVASGTSPAARAAPEPPDEPPGDHSRPQGLRVGPNTSLSVHPWNANSGMLVLPSTIAPAAIIRSTVISLRSAGGRSSIVREPKFVTFPARSVLSLTRSGRPASGPSAPRWSSRSASASASSGHTAVTAFSAGSSRSIRSTDTRTSSTAERRRSRTAWASCASI